VYLIYFLGAGRNPNLTPNKSSTNTQDTPSHMVDTTVQQDAATTTSNASDKLSMLITQSPLSNLSKEEQIKWATNFVSALSILRAQEKQISSTHAAPASPSQAPTLSFDYKGTKDAGFKDTSIFDSPLLCQIDQQEKQLCNKSTHSSQTDLDHLRISCRAIHANTHIPNDTSISVPPLPPDISTITQDNTPQSSITTHTSIGHDLAEAISLLHQIITKCFVKPRTIFIHRLSDNQIERSISVAQTLLLTEATTNETSIVLAQEKPSLPNTIGHAIQHTATMTMNEMEKRFHAMDQKILCLKNKNAALEHSLKAKNSSPSPNNSSCEQHSKDNGADPTGATQRNPKRPCAVPPTNMYEANPIAATNPPTHEQNPPQPKLCIQATLHPMARKTTPPQTPPTN
jgi:hypothetical protein